jgi:hypothetical protein
MQGGILLLKSPLRLPDQPLVAHPAPVSGKYIDSRILSDRGEEGAQPFSPRNCQYYFFRPSIILIRSRIISVIGVVDTVDFTAAVLTFTGFGAFLTFFRPGFLDLAVAFFLATAFFLEADFGFAAALRLGADFFLGLAFFTDFAFFITITPIV